MKKNSSFALRLTVPIVLCTAAIFVASILIVGSVVNTILTNQAIEKSQSALKTASLYVNTSLNEIQTVIENNAIFVQEWKNDTSMFREITAKVLRDNSGIIGSSISLNPYKYNGMKYSGYSCYSGNPRKVIYTYLNSDVYDYTTMDWFQIPLFLGQPAWSEVYFDEGGGNERMTTYSYPLKDDNGDIFAIFTADISLDWLTNKAISIKPYEESQNLILSRGGKFLTGGKELINGETIFSLALELSDTTLLKSGKRIVSGVTDYCEFSLNDEDVIAIYGPLENGWSMMIVSYYSDVVAPVIFINAFLLIMLFIALTIIIFISLRIIKRYTRPLSDFSRIVLNIGQDKFDNVLPEIKSNDEIKTLCDAIGKMQSSMKENVRHRQDLQSAKYIQTKVVPPSSSFESEFANLDVILEPAREVGGDLYDFHHSKRRNKLFFLVGDVSGKGMPAALFMSMVISSVRLMTKYFDRESDIVSKVNDNISSDNDMDMFVTLLFGSIDTISKKLIVCSAGHNPPIIVTPDGNAKYLKVKANLVGGAIDGFEYESDELDLSSGTKLIIYTDGVTEAERSDSEQYGEERLLQWASSIPKEMSNGDAVKSLREDVRDFVEYRKYCSADSVPCQNYPQNDDITIMIITIL